MSVAGTTGEVAGYPIVRVLSQTRDALLLLGRCEGSPRVLRVFRPSCPSERSDQEIDARGRAPLNHAAGVLDLASSDEGAPIAVLEYLSGVRVDHLLAQRHGTLSAGEAVTLVVPILETLHAAHELGLTFGGVEADGVRLRADGAPVITRFRGARAGPPLPAHYRMGEAEYRVDREAGLAFAARVVDAVATGEGASLSEAIARHDADLRATIDAFYDCAEPQPLRTSGPLDPPSGTPAVSSRASVGQEPIAPEPGPRVPGAQQRAVRTTHVESPGVVAEAVAPVESRWQPLLERLAVPSSIACLVGDAERRARAALRSATEAVVSRVRPRFLFMAAGGAGAVLVAALLVGQGDSASDTSAHEPGTSSATEPTTLVDPVQREEGVALTEPRAGAASEARDVVLEASEAPELLLDPAPEQWADVVQGLIERWVTCQAGPQPADCAARSTQTGSSARQILTEQDSRVSDVLEQWVVALTRGGATLVVVERMGSAVIVDLIAEETTTASLLLMRSEAGWRLRDVLVGDGIP